MKYLPIFSILCFLCLISLYSQGPEQTNIKINTEKSSQDQSRDSNEHSELAFLSDIQTPIWIEKILLKPYRNEEATDSLMQDIARRRPKTLFILGDLVSTGNNQNEWKILDKYLKKIRKNNIEIFAIPGNHDFMLDKKEGIKNFKQHFPNYNNFGYDKIIDSVAVLLINSNELKDSTYIDMYKKKMHLFEKDDAVKFIIVATHYSPFTNSTIVESDRDVRDSIIPTFRRTPKAKLFISGHSHNLEYFIHKDKNFLVIGGGGGLQQPLKPFNERRWVDRIHDEDKPLYFYITVKRSGDILNVSSRGFKKDFKFFESKIVDINCK